MEEKPGEMQTLAGVVPGGVFGTGQGEVCECAGLKWSRSRKPEGPSIHWKRRFGFCDSSIAAMLWAITGWWLCHPREVSTSMGGGARG